MKTLAHPLVVHRHGAGTVGTPGEDSERVGLGCALAGLTLLVVGSFLFRTIVRRRRFLSQLDGLPEPRVWREGEE